VAPCRWRDRKRRHLVHAVEQQGPAGRQPEFARLFYERISRNMLEETVVDPFANLAQMPVARDDFLPSSQRRQDVEFELSVGKGGSGHRGSPGCWSGGANLLPRRLAAPLRA
jgi:hypothetical protein